MSESDTSKQFLDSTEIFFVMSKENSFLHNKYVELFGYLSIEYIIMFVFFSIQDFDLQKLKHLNDFLPSKPFAWKWIFHSSKYSQKFLSQIQIEANEDSFDSFNRSKATLSSLWSTDFGKNPEVTRRTKLLWNNMNEMSGEKLTANQLQIKHDIIGIKKLLANSFTSMTLDLCWQLCSKKRIHSVNQSKETLNIFSVFRRCSQNSFHCVFPSSIFGL